MDEENLKRIIGQLKEWGNLNSASRLLVKNVCIMNKWLYGEIWMPDKTGTYMIWSGYWGVNEDEFEAFSRFSSMHKFAKGIGFVGKIWEEEKVIFSDKIQEDSDFLRSELSIKNRLTSAIGIPILKDDNILLILTFFKNNLTETDEESARMIFSYSTEIGNRLST